MIMKKFISVILIVASLLSILPYSYISAEKSIVKFRPFRDIVKDCWFDQSATYCFEHGYMKGTAEGCFDPGLNITRSMAVMIFCNMNTLDPFYEAKSFNDVKSSDWFYSSVQWAYYNSITGGTSGSTFTPNAAITRQDFIKMLYNYYMRFAHMPDISPIEMDLCVYSDHTDISDYAAESLQWAINYGIISGYTDMTLRPKASITRAEAVKIIMYYDNIFGHRFEYTTLTNRNCITDGNILYRCTLCDERRLVTTKAYHIYDEGKITVHPTCEGKGIREYSCIYCNNTRQSDISELGHSYYTVKTVEATPLKKGYTIYRCNRCDTEIKDNYTNYAPLEDGILTIDEYMGIDDLAGYLTANINKYLGTPYKALINYIDTPWMLLRDKGSYSDPAMNCTGFVASVVQRSGGDLSKLVNYNRGAYANGYNWLRTFEKYNIYKYKFYSVQQAIQSGKMRKGDLIFFVPPKDSDCHLGIFWGNTPYENKIIHCTAPSSYNYSSGVRISGVQISGISSGTPYDYFYVIPLGSVKDR